MLVGLSGWEPETVDPDAIARASSPRSATTRALDARRHAGRSRSIPDADLVFDYGFLPGHPNGMTFVADFADGAQETRRYYSIGGGAIIEEGEAASRANVAAAVSLLVGRTRCWRWRAAQGCSIADLERANEAAWRAPAETDAFLDAVREAMFGSIDRGMRDRRHPARRAEGAAPRQGAARQACSSAGRAAIPSRCSTGSACGRWR